MVVEFSNRGVALGSVLKKRFLLAFTTLWITLFSVSNPAFGSDNIYVGEVRNVNPAPYRELMAAVSTEAFLSNIIYDRSARELGKEFLFDYTDSSKTSFKTATLRKYQYNADSGFTGAIFETSENRVFIVFGGTTAQDAANKSEKLIDVIADIQLLSYDVLSSQVSETTEFMIEAREYIGSLKDEGGNDKYDWENDVIITGHSLGGGLAQYAGMMSNLTTVTFNTAPAPITPLAFAAMQPYFEYTYCANCGVNTDQTQIINIFSNDDPLTIILQAVEAVEYGVTTTVSGSYQCSGITCSTEEDLAYLAKFRKFEWLYARLTQQLENSWLWGLIRDNTSYLELTTEVLIGGVALGAAIAADINEIAFMRAIMAIKNGDIQGFTERLKDTYSIPSDFDMKSLIIGARYEVNTNSFHSMFDMIRQSYAKTDDFNLIPIKQNLPEFYSYIDGSYFDSDFFREYERPLPANSKVEQASPASRIAYYYYNSSDSYEDLLAQEVSMHWDAFNFYVVSHEKIEAFASTYLNIGGLATQVGVLATDTMSNVSDEELNLKTKKKIVSGVLSSGKSTVQDMLPKEAKDISDILDDCMRLSWIPLDDIVSSGFTKVVGKEIKKTASTVVNCALGQTVKGTSRTYSAIAGRHHIKKWQHKSVAKIYLDEYFRCGFDNDACMAAKFGNHQNYQDQIQHIITTNQLDQGIDLLVAAGAHEIISEYIYDITNLTNEVLNLIPESKYQTFQFASRVTNTLDYNVELLSLADNQGDELTLSFQVNNTSGRDLFVYNLELIVITESDTRFYSLSDHPEVLTKLLKAYSANTSAMPVNIVFNFNESNLVSGNLSEARIVTELRYGSGLDNLIDDRVQRVLDLNPQELLGQGDVNTDPVYNEDGEIAETMLEITLPEGQGREILSSHSSTHAFTALANDIVSLRYLLGAESSSAQAQCWDQPFLDEGDTIQQRYLVLVNEDTGDEVEVDFIVENDCATASFTLPASGTWSLKQYGYRYTLASDPANVLAENFGFNSANNIIAGDPNRPVNGGGDEGQPYPATHPLNDTGITTCSNSSANDLPCPVAGFEGQDAEFGRDALAAAGELQKVGAGQAGFDYTKLDANGNDLPASAAQWSCVRDNVTNLVWEVKTDDGGLQDKDNTYTWYNPDTSKNGGHPGVEGSRNTLSYAVDVNNSGLCGGNNWRMPTKNELLSIIDFGNSSSVIDGNFFPNSTNDWYWSSSVRANSSSTVFATAILFSDGRDASAFKGQSKHVRLVRNEENQ